MENIKEGGGGGDGDGGAEAKSNNGNPSSISPVATESDAGWNLPPSRTPFTNLSQVDADLALARTLQEQERAYMMLRMNGEGSGYGTSEAGSYMGSYVEEDDEEDENTDADLNEDLQGDDAGTDSEDQDAFDVHDSLEAANSNELDPSAFSSDEAFARALQDAEDRELVARMTALTGATHINDWDAEDTDDSDDESQETWEEVDPDELSYEELVALGEVVGTESRGLSANTIASLPSLNYKGSSNNNNNNEEEEEEQCVICRLEFEDNETLTVLSCTHSYHSNCINNWLQINKVCPVCSAEVSETQ